MKIIVYILVLCFMLLCQFSGILIADGARDNEIISTIIGIGIFTLEFIFVLRLIDEVTNNDWFRIFEEQKIKSIRKN